jgi:hypothetical protein
MPLVAGVLNGMCDKDLHQRYSGCWVWYNGRIVFVRDFSHPYILITTSDGKELVESFDYKLLDTSRPRAKWYIAHREIHGMKFCAHVSFPPKRQYHRGLCTENVHVKFVERSFVGQVLFETVLGQGYEPINTTRLKPGEEGIYKDQTLVRKDHLSEEKWYVVYFRSRCVATYNVEQKVCRLIHPRFKQEVEEAVVGINEYEYVEGGKEPREINPFVLNPEVAEGVRDRRNYLDYVQSFYRSKGKYERIVRGLLNQEVRYD